MMQDYPKTLSASAKVGFTVCDVWLGYSPVKNNAADAAAKVRTLIRLPNKNASTLSPGIPLA